MLDPPRSSWLYVYHFPSEQDRRRLVSAAAVSGRHTVVDHMQYDDIEHWVRGDGLEIVLIILGSILLARFVHWAAGRYTRRYDLAVDTAPDADPTRRQRQTRALVQALEWVLVGLVYFSAVLLVVLRLGLPISSLVAPATVVGVALGFGAQRVVQDLLAGFFFLSEHSFGFGDTIHVSPPGSVAVVAGTVEELTLRTTKLRGVGGELVIIPNGQIGHVTNLSRDWARVVVDVPVSADAELEAAVAVLEWVAQQFAEATQWQSALLDGPEVWGVESIKVGYVLVRMTARTLPARQWDVARALRAQAAKALAAEGMSPSTPVATVG
jgi:moderate conductance mechanosensitive channel